MERELWQIISQHITRLDRRTQRGRSLHTVGRIVRVLLWAVLHDRPVHWACDRRNWSGVRPPVMLPDQSTMSRRLRRLATLQMIEQLTDALDTTLTGRLYKYLDGKPLTVARHSQDRHATFGRGAGGKDRGYKFHAVYAGSNRPVVWHLTGLHASEHQTATPMIQRCNDTGYVIADKNYDANHLYHTAAMHGHRLITPRRYHKAKALGHHAHSPHRRDVIARLQSPSRFVNDLLRQRRSVETRFAHLTNFAGGLTHLPPWIRRPHRVATWIAGKIIVRMAKDQYNRIRVA